MRFDHWFLIVLLPRGGAAGKGLDRVLRVPPAASALPLRGGARFANRVRSTPGYLLSGLQPEEPCTDGRRGLGWCPPVTLIWDPALLRRPDGAKSRVPMDRRGLGWWLPLILIWDPTIFLAFLLLYSLAPSKLDTN